MNPASPTPRHPSPARAAHLRSAAGSAFTLMEIIVAVAAVALVAVGLASIFDAVGKTVNGGKRVSLLNQYAGLIENQMRKDFEEMSRDGFLVIRQQHIDSNNGGTPDGAFVQIAAAGAQPDHVRVSPLDEQPRPRRADEIIFFARGQFQTRRAPVHPGAIVTSDSAMIYYGHGQRRREGASFTDTAGAPVTTIFEQPRTDDTNADVTARLGIGNDAGNPNLYAGDWTLLRKVTLLVKPDPGQSRPIPSALVFTDPARGNERRLSPDPNDTPPPSVAELSRIANSRWQIALQPAAHSVFRSLNRYYPRDVSGGDPWNAPNRWFREPVRVNLASGIVDIATTDLTEIKSIVQGLGMGWDPNGPNFRAQLAALPRAFDSAQTGDAKVLSDYMRPFTWSHPFPDPVQTPVIPPSTSAPPSSVELMQVWMNEAFPTESSLGPRWGRTNNLSNPTNGSGWDPPGFRPRAEPEPVDLLNVIAGNFATAGSDPEFRAVYQRADQLALVASNFLPRCSEFAIDWSFGKTDPATNELIWHGPATRYDANNNGIDANDPYSLLPYPFNARAPHPSPDAYHAPGSAIPARDAAWHRVWVPRMGYMHPTDRYGRPVDAKPFPYMDILPREKFFYDHVISDRLIYGYRAWQPDEPVPAVLTSFFGYADPTFKQDNISLQYNTTQETYDRLTGDDITRSLNDPPGFVSDGRVTPGMLIDRDGNGYIGTTNGTTIDPGAVAQEIIPGEPAAASIPWAWPRMVRVTVTLSDALDPTIESTFQFVFNVAPDPPISN